MGWSRKIALLSFCVALFGADTKYVQTQYGKTAFVSADNGSKTVVFQAGLGDDKSVWEKLLKKSNNSFSYFTIDRLGKGDSSKPTIGRSPCDVAKEQSEALQNSGFKPPYILVGHSLGGLYQYVYAKMYPSEVSAMVLLDPTHPRHWENLQKESDSLAFVVKTMRLIAFGDEDTKEFDAQTQCLDALDIDSALTIPTTLLFSGNLSALERGSYEKMLTRLRGDWLRLIETANARTIQDSTHYLQKDAPNDVLMAISLALGQQ